MVSEFVTAAGLRAVLSGALAATLAACNSALPPQATQPSQPTREQSFAMQERCGRDAREWFRQFYGDGDKLDAYGEVHSEYRNRYDAGSNRCLALVSGITTSKPIGSGGPTISQWASLVDVNENHEIGTCMKLVSPNKMTVCELDGNKYPSLADWEAAAETHMDQ